jgi:hypothetical protein
MKTTSPRRTILLILSALLLASCMKEPAETEQLSAAAPRLKSAGAWERVFTDEFTPGGTLSQWIAAERFDYNSKLCKYLASNPQLSTCEGAGCLVLTATKNGSIWNSGFLTSKFSFKPALNQEYHTSAKIKFTAIQGSVYKDFSSTYGAWPAFWTVQGNQWPAYGEIDIVEGYSYGTYARYAANLFYGRGRNVLGTTCERPYPVPEGWHVYDMYWANTAGSVSVTIQLDGVTVASYTNAANSKLKLENFGPHTIMLNLNVGDNYGIFNNKLINVLDKTLMWVDWVTVDRRSL